MSNNFLYLIGLLPVNWNGMFPLLVLLFSEAVKFFNNGIFRTITVITLMRDLIFATRRQGIFVLLRKKTFYFFHFQMLSLKIIFQIALGYLSISHKSWQSSQSFAIFAKLYAHQMNVFVYFAKINLHKIFFSDSRKGIFAKNRLFWAC